MSEWWTYSLSDFLLFSPRTYYRLFELYNLAIWPTQPRDGSAGSENIRGAPIEDRGSPRAVKSGAQVGPMQGPDLQSTVS